MDILLARHRKEQKELQAKITSKKKNATKKTRKGVNDECERLEQDLKERHRTEIEALALNAAGQDVTEPGGSNEAAEVNEELNGDTQPKEFTQEQSVVQDMSSTSMLQKDSQMGKKPNRQKARLARRAEEKEAQMEAAAKEAANMPDQRKQELESMKKHMESLDLVETMIRPDGHCLYSACALTLPTQVRDYHNVRLAAADYINAHPDDFAPFMEEPLDIYTRKIRDTAEWGGHLELQAIAKAFEVNINILQASGHVEKIQSNSPSGKEIWLAYYKHSFGLGEHYNALKQASAG